MRQGQRVGQSSAVHWRIVLDADVDGVTRGDQSGIVTWVELGDCRWLRSPPVRWNIGLEVEREKRDLRQTTSPGCYSVLVERISRVLQGVLLVRVEDILERRTRLEGRGDPVVLSTVEFIGDGVVLIGVQEPHDIVNQSIGAKALSSLLVL